MAAPAASLEIPWPALRAGFLAFPDVAFFHAAGAMYGTFKSHREAFLQQSDIDLQNDVGQGFVVRKVSGRAASFRTNKGARSFFYVVQPRSWKRKKGQTLDDIMGESFTASKAAKGLEEGGPVRPRGRFLALPIGQALRSDGQVKSKWNTPRRFLRGPKKETRTSPQHGKPQNRIIWWNKPSSRSRRSRRHWVPVFLLVPRVVLPADLQYLNTWDRLSSDRRRRFRKTLQNIARDALPGLKGGKRGRR